MPKFQNCDTMTDMLHRSHQDAQQALEKLLVGVVSDFRCGNERAVRAVLQARLPITLRPLLTPASSAGLSHLKDDEENDFVVHYTTINAVVKMIRQVSRYEQRNKDQSGDDTNIPEPAFRMYHIEGFNDPSEGVVADELLLSKFKWFQIPDRRKSDAYICSFATPDKAGNSKNGNEIGDNLMFWRLYGNNGMGCSIKIKSSKLVESTDKDIFRVLYWNRNNEHLYCPQIHKVLDTINNAVFKCIRISKTLNNATAEICSNIVMSMLDEHRCFVKALDYKHEAEYRIVVLKDTPDAHGVKFDKRDFPYVRRYINEGPKLKSILSSDTVITVGPQVRAPYAIKAYIESLLKDANLSGQEVRISNVKYTTP